MCRRSLQGLDASFEETFMEIGNSRQLRLALALLWPVPASCGILRAQEAWKVGTVRAAAGETRSGALSVPRGPDGETNIPITLINGGRPRDPAASQFCSNTAVTRGKPATTIESGGMGIADDEESIARIERGVASVMRHLHMLEGKADLPAHPRWYEPAEVLRFPESLPEKAGLFFPLARKGQMVARDALLGYVTDFFGKRVYDLRSPFAGEVLYIIGTPPISAGEPLAFIGAVRSEAPTAERMTP